MKQYICDKCGDNFLTTKRLENELDVCESRSIPANSKLDYPIREFLGRCGDFCPLCESQLYNQIHLIMNFLEPKKGVKTHE